MEALAAHVLKAGLLLVVAAALGYSFAGLVRFLYGSPDLLQPIVVMRDNKADKEFGAHASELLQYRLSDVKRIVEWTSQPTSVASPLPQIPTRTTAVDLQLTALGVDIAGVLNSLRSLASYRSRIAVTIVIHDSSVSAMASYDGPSAPSAQDGSISGPPWKIEGTKSVDEALFQLATNITRLRSAEKDARFRPVTDSDFYEFVLAIRDLQGANATDDTARATRLRSQARSRLEAITRQPKPTEFADAYTRLGELYEEENRSLEARSMFERSLALFKDERVAKKLANIKQAAASETRPVASGPSETKGRIRPLRSGYSIGGASTSAGTIGAFARDSSGKTYIISAAHVLATNPTITSGPVVQPAIYDGGKLRSDQVATFSKSTPLHDRSPIWSLLGLAELSPTVAFDPEIQQIGQLKGVRKDLAGLLGIKVRAVGRTSGLMNGVVEAVQLTFTMVSPNQSDGGKVITFTNGIATTRMSAGGDSGALVVDEEGYAVGVIVAGSETMTIVAPIAQFLESFDATLLTSSK